jgi:hypothetical protein
VAVVAAVLALSLAGVLAAGSRAPSEAWQTLVNVVRAAGH